MSAQSKPKVTIGLPVYNGENYLAPAIESVLKQTYGDFELFISDNASTDSTRDICLDFAARDPRVVYHRQDRNIGAALNHNFCGRRATGKYFKFAAHDDLLEPEYLARCVAPLEEHPDAVLCQSRTRIVGDEGEGIAVHYPGLESSSAAERFGVVILKPHWCVEVYGLIRTSALARTNLEAPYFGGDKVLLAELALLGKFLHVPEPLFINRDHAARSMRAVPFHLRQVFQDTSRQRQVVTHWALYTDYWRAVDRHVRDRREKIRCYGKLLQWWFANLHAARLTLDVALALVPRAAEPIYRLRKAYHRKGIGSEKDRWAQPSDPASVTAKRR